MSLVVKDIYLKDIQSLEEIGKMAKLNCLDRVAFNSALCNSILLQFTEPQVYDLAIPSSYGIHSLVGIASNVLSGQIIDPSHINCVTASSEFVDYFGFLSKKKVFAFFKDKDFSNDFCELFNACSDENSVMDLHMLLSDRNLRNEFVYGHGNWYAFRDGKKKQIKEEVEQILSPEYLANINLLGKTFQQYICRVNAPARCS